jgi:hypothetical protein
MYCYFLRKIVYILFAVELKKKDNNQEVTHRGLGLKLRRKSKLEFVYLISIRCHQHVRSTSSNHE